MNSYARMKIWISAVYMLLLSSCSVYYTTSEVDQQLKTTVQQVNDNCTNLTTQIGSFEKEFNSMGCPDTEAPYATAKEMMEVIDASLKQINVDKATVNQLYADFQSYSKGKDKISSSSPEWKKLKESRKRMKEKLHSIEELGKTMVKNAEELHIFVEETIVPRVTKVVVADYINSFNYAINSFKERQLQLSEQTKMIGKQVQQQRIRFGRMYKQTFDSLEADVQRIESLNATLSSYSTQLEYSVEQFKKQTMDQPIIYSCSPNWLFVNATETSIATTQTAINKIHQQIEEINQQMNRRIAGLK